MTHNRAVATGFVLALFASPIFAAEFIVGIASVIDADTIELHGERIRLVGIDAPEGRQTCELDGQPWRCGQAAAFALADHIEGKTLECRGDEQDRYGRTLAVCWLGDEDLNGLWPKAGRWPIGATRRPMSGRRTPRGWPAGGYGRASLCRRGIGGRRTDGNSSGPPRFELVMHSSCALRCGFGDLQALGWYQEAPEVRH